MATQRSSRLGAAQNLAFNAAGGASVASAAFAGQTFQIRVAFASGTAGAAVRIAVGDGAPIAGATSTLLPANLVEYITVTPGQRLAALSDTASAGTLSITEITG